MINKVNASSQKINNLQQRMDRSLEFNKFLEKAQKSSELKISSHAVERLKEREIQLSDMDILNLTQAVDTIRNKGGREALIVYKDVAFITSVKNNVVITAVDKENLKENVFTNIDSAMII